MFWPPILPSEQGFLMTGVIWGVNFGLAAWLSHETFTNFKLRANKRKLEKRRAAEAERIMSEDCFNDLRRE